jgi:hypothetical protein
LLLSLPSSFHGLGLLVGVQRREVLALQVVEVGLPLPVVYEVAGADLLGLLVGV